MATWRKGQAWRVVDSLERLNAQIRAAYPRAVPPATPASSWGAIADDAHSSTSDHYPHYYAPLGKTAVVCARDFPHAPQLGLDAHALAEQLRRSRDPRIAYIISNRRITGPNHGWQWEKYDGSDPHDTHIHASTVHTVAADDPRDWPIGEDDDVSKQDVLDATATSRPFVSDGVRREATAAGWGNISDRALLEYYWSGVNHLIAQVTALTAIVTTMGKAIEAGGGNVDTAKILAGMRDALADLAEGGAAQVRAEQS